MDLSVKLETGRALSLPSPDRFSASSRGWEAWAAVSSAPIEAQPLQLSDSEELDVVSANAIDTEDSPPQSRAYEELVEVVTRVVEKLSIDWPAEREHVRSKGKLDLPWGQAKQVAAFQKLLPCHTHISGAAEQREQPQTSKPSSSYRAAQKQSVAYRAPLPKDWGNSKRTQPQPSKGKTDLRTVIISKRAVTLWCLFLIVFFIIFVFCWMFSLSFRSPLICYVLLLISSNWVISWRFSIKWILRSSEESGCDFGPVALLQTSRWLPDQTVFSAFECISFD